jgi:hypothetical protein
MTAPIIPMSFTEMMNTDLHRLLQVIQHPETVEGWEPQTLAEADAMVYGGDLGTRCIVSGGEVLELGHTEPDDLDPSDEEYPF